MLLNDFTVPMSELNVSITTEFESDQLSGETSSTSSAHKGIKPKSVNVSFVVRYKDASQLTDFYRIAEATDDNGDLVVYNVTDNSANAANIRQVIFFGRIEQREMVGLKGWRVSFTLQEHLSVAEKTEQRQSFVESESIPLQDSQGITGFEKVVQGVESSLA